MRVANRDWEASSHCNLMTLWNASRRVRFSFRRLEAASGGRFFGGFPTQSTLLSQSARSSSLFCISIATPARGNRDCEADER